MYKHILVTLDGKPESEQAIKQAVSLAKLYDASLTGISVIEKLPAYAASVGEVEEMKSQFENFFTRVQNNAKKAAESAGISMKTTIKAGNAAQTIIHYAEANGVDLIVVSAGGRKGLGGTADKITENAPCSVLVARISLPYIKVKNAMTKEVTFISPETPLSDVVKLLVEKELKSAPVLENEKIVGIITGGDILTRAAMGLRLSLQRILPTDIFTEQIQQLAQEGKTAKDIMTSPVITIDEDDLVTRAAALMSEKNVKRLPVINQQGKLVGIISRLDILAMVANSELSSEEFTEITKASASTAGDIMFRNIPTAAIDSNLSEVINKISSSPVRRVVVIDENRHVLGIIVDSDLVRTGPRAKGGWLKNIFPQFSSATPDLVNTAGIAGDIMSREVFSVQPETPITEVIRLMLDKKIKRLVVTDEDKRLVGMVSRESILRLLADGKNN